MIYSKLTSIFFGHLFQLIIISKHPKIKCRILN